MAKKPPKISLSQPIQPRGGDLEKLFAAPKDAEQAAGLQLVAIRLDAILPDPLQPRRTFQPGSLRELSESIKQDGVIQPIEVTQMGANQFMIVHGERRWRAAQIAGLETIPAVVRRRDYDEVTRFVRQLVENIQREDLNDVDRAAGLLHLRELMEEEQKTGKVESVPSDEPWSKQVTWAKVGKRLGYSRQRIHQLIQLLKLPEEIREAVREGTLSERDSRIYQGLKPSQQKALYEARKAGDLNVTEVEEVARRLKELPDETVAETVRALRQPEPMQVLEENEAWEPPTALHSEPGWVEESVLSGRTTRPTAVDRLDWIRGHLARIRRQGLTAVERKETLRLLGLIQQDVASLITVISGKEA